MLCDLVIGQTVGDALKTVQAFSEMVSSRGTVDGDEEVLGDGIAFAGVSKYPARVKCELLGWFAFKAAVAQATASSKAVAQATASSKAVAEATASSGAVAEAYHHEFKEKR